MSSRVKGLSTLQPERVNTKQSNCSLNGKSLAWTPGIPTMQNTPPIGFPYLLHDLRDSRGRTPLWLAVSGQHSSTCSLLIGAGADPRVVDNQGVSLEDLARKPDVKDIIALALAHNA